MFGSNQKNALPDAATALPGRDEPMELNPRHFISGRSMRLPYPEGAEVIVFAIGCFWGAERKFWQASGVTVTAVGYAGGITPNPTYDEVCTGRTGHTEVVLVVYEPESVPIESLLQLFWEAHDPTQGMRQGNDIGTQYRSAIYTTLESQLAVAERSRDHYQQQLGNRRFGEITTEIAPLDCFYFAEEYHQQYLAKNPNGYCGLGGTGISCGVEFS